MEPLGAICEGEWGSLSGMYTVEEADFMAQLLNNNALLPNELIGDSSLGVPSPFWPGHESSMNVEGFSESPYYTLHIDNSNFCRFSKGSLWQQSYYFIGSHPVLASNHCSMAMDFGMMDVKNTGSFHIEGDECLNQEKSMHDIDAEEYAGNKPAAVLLPQNGSQHRRESELMPLPESIPEGKYNNAPDNSKKRSPITGDIVSIIASFSC